MSLLRRTFTRSRPYNKNDQAHVEQKNGSVVGRWIGHDRYEGERVTRMMNGFCELLRLYNNFFPWTARAGSPASHVQISVCKLISWLRHVYDKTRHGSKVSRKYDKAKTPYQKLLASGTQGQARRHRTGDFYRRLNPVRLRQQLQDLQDQIWAASNDALVVVRSIMT